MGNTPNICLPDDYKGTERELGCHKVTIQTKSVAYRKRLIPSPTEQQKHIAAQTIQKVYKGYVFRTLFISFLKSQLTSQQTTFIHKQYNLLHKSSPPSPQVIANQGWKDHYASSSDETFFNFNAGFTFANCYLISNDQIYYGSVNMNNQKHGLGELTTRDCSFIGTWRCNLFTGWNTKEYIDGSVKEGKFVNGVLNGKGRFLNSNGDFYEGMFVDDKKQGCGKEITNQMVYIGEFNEDKIEGKGKITFVQNGDVYEGEFRNNKFEGKGTFKFKNGDVYEGEFVKGNMHGKGKYVFADGQVYEGDYWKGVKHGNGKITFVGGSIYEGPFVKGVQDGIGTYIKKGEVMKVEFKNGKFVKVIK